MHSLLIFQNKEWIELVFGGSITVEMSCYQVQDLSQGFERAYVFGFVAYDNADPSRKIILDQHKGKPCHFHIEGQEFQVVPGPENIDEAIKIFVEKIREYFGEILWDI